MTNRLAVGGDSASHPWVRLCERVGTTPASVASVARAGLHRFAPPYRHRAGEISYLAGQLEQRGHRVPLPDLEAAHNAWAAARRSP